MEKSETFECEKRTLRMRYGQEWEKVLRERIAANIWKRMKELSISSLELKENLVGIPPVWFSERSLMRIIQGDELVKGEDELEVLALFLDTTVKSLVRVTPLSTIERNTGIEGWLDSIAKAKAKSFCDNVEKAAKQNKMAYEDLAALMPQLEKLKAGEEPLAANDIIQASTFLGLVDSPWLLSTTNGRPLGYPKTAVTNLGRVHRSDFAFNLRATMNIRLLSIPRLAQATGKSPCEILDYMAGKDAPDTRDDLVVFAEKASIPQFELSGDYPRRVAYQPACQPPKAELPPLVVRSGRTAGVASSYWTCLLAANIKKIIRCKEREPKDIQKKWEDAGMKCHISDIWDDDVNRRKEPGRQAAILEVVAHYGVPMNILRRPAALSESETEQKRQAILRAANELSSRNRLVLMAMIEEEYAQGTQIPM